MRFTGFLFIPLLLSILFSSSVDAQNGITKDYDLLKNPSHEYNNRVDNMSYWRRMVREGKVKQNPQRSIAPAIYKGSIIRGLRKGVMDSPDVLITGGETTQSENSVFVSPFDNEIIINSNNSSDYPVQVLFGADYFASVDAGQNWEGSIYGAGEDNNGDPSVAVSNNGRMYIGKISASFGQNVAWSQDNGITWHEVEAAALPGSFPNLFDKNHLTIDNSLASPYEGRVYTGWSRFVSNDIDNAQIQLIYSADDGISWSTPLTISQAVNAVSHNQGVNFQTGPTGQLYAVWSIYDNWPGDEAAIGFARSYNGGVGFEPSWRIINNIKGLRYSGTSKDMRMNSFPAMAVDNSFGPFRGRIYVTWSNKGVPGINTGNDIDVYVIYSDNEGLTWSSPIRVNQDAAGNAKQHFLPWICCDAETGTVSMIFYDDRNTSSLQCEVFAADSYDGGNSWEDFRISDVAFTPSPIPGMAASYFGDYLGISAQGRKVYPVWTDNRNGKAQTYMSPYSTSPLPGQAFVVYEANVLNSPIIPGNQFLIYGDSATMDVEMSNVGDLIAENVVVTLRTTSPYIQITDSIENYGNLIAGQSLNLPGAYALKISDTIPDNLKIKFVLKASDGDSVWFSHFYKYSSAPQLVIQSPFIIDSAGNNNGVADPGETIRLLVTIKNTGDFSIQDLNINLQSFSAYVSLIQWQAFVLSLFPGEEQIVFFDMILADTIAYNTLLAFKILASDSKYNWQKMWNTRTGLIYEDWESGGFLKFPWMRTGNVLWEITQNPVYERSFSASSGQPGDSKQSTLTISYEVMTEDSISFYYKTSTEANYDFLEFYIDNQLKGKWSGLRDWKYISYYVPAGQHSFRWKYQKDIFAFAGEDMVWIDYLRLPFFFLPQINAGEDKWVCNSVDSVLMNATAQFQQSVLWTTKGDGHFNNPRILNPAYFPGQNDRSNGEVKLNLKASNALASVTDTMLLHFVQPPVSPQAMQAIPDTYCADRTESIQLIAQVSETDTLLWYSSDYVQIPGQGSPLAIEPFVQSDWIYAVAKNSCGFSSFDSLYIHVNPLPSINLGVDTSVCKSQVLLLDAG
ncbi:MAG: hypothetical protein Q7J34_13890 [Bacteroidales bacterium]|nr:hypothetical protein [Bacteroidales bacterium]